MAQITATWRGAGLKVSADVNYLMAGAESQVRMIAQLRAELAEAAARFAGAEARTRDLTPSERRVILAVLEGKTSRQIAEEMRRALSTVETWRARAIRKLGGVAAAAGMR